MQPRFSLKHNAAMTLFEIGVVVALVVILAVIFLPRLAINDGRKRARPDCVNNLRQINLAYKIWEGDNGDIFPMGVSVTNGGSMEMVQGGDVIRTFQVMSNELSTPYILRCPADVARKPAGSFAGLTSSNISYFVSADAINDANPQMVLVGDCNLEVGGVPVKPGLNSFSTNDPVTWSATRHIKVSYLGMADGSVQSSTLTGLKNYLLNIGSATNRFAIP